MAAHVLVFVMGFMVMSTSPGDRTRPDPVFGQNGHRIVAAIAERHLLPLTRLRVRQLLGPYSLARVSMWADAFRGSPEGRHTAPWHYVNIPDRAPYREPETASPSDIYQAVRLQERILADTTRSMDERAIALRFVVHLVADIHQPLHVGRAEDRGGNDIAVRWFGQPSNLHRVWDSDLLEHQGLSFTEYVAFLDIASAEEIARLMAGDYRDWMRESQALRDTVYAPLAGAADAVPDLRWDYVNAMTPILERRLLEAGIRLAAVLNRALGNSGPVR